jgi:hypothetical protein
MPNCSLYSNGVKDMGFLQRLRKVLGLSKEIDIEEYMNAADLENIDVLHEATDFYIKPVALESDADTKLIEEELKNRNIILLNVTPMSKRTATLKQVVNNLKRFTTKIDGDIARIDNDKILLTPSRVKIVKKRI